MDTFELLTPRDRIQRAIGITLGGTLLAGVVVLALNRPVVVVGALLVLAGGFAIVRFPIAALVFVLFLLPFHIALVISLGQKAHVGIGPLQYWKDVAIVGLFARAIYTRLWCDRRLPFRDPGDNLLLLYIVAMIAIAIASPSRPTVGAALGRYVEGPMILLTIRYLRPSRRELWWCAGAVLTAVAIIGAVAVIETLGPKVDFQHWYGVKTNAAGDPFFLGPGKGYRSGSFLSSPFTLGFVMAGAAPFAWALALLRGPSRPAATVAAVACSGGLIAAATRSGYLGGMVAVLVVILFAVRNPAIRISLLSIVVVVIASGMVYYTSKGSNVLVRPQSNAAHQDALERDFQLLAARPFGYGMGTTDTHKLRAGSGPGQLGFTESSFMAKALETGVQGLALYLIALFTTLFRLRRTRFIARRAGDGQAVAIAAGAIGAMVGVSLAGMSLGVHELVVEEMLWALPGIALAWPIAGRAVAARASLESMSSRP